jgi:hypothetical protein
LKIRIEKKNGDPMWKNPRTRLRFSIGVIIANFVLGIVGMLLGADLTALGVFLGLANAPLYAYVLGESFAPTKIPDSYYNQGLSGILNQGQGQGINISTVPSVVTETQQKPDEFNNPNYPQSNIPLPIVQKPDNELG